MSFSLPLKNIDSIAAHHTQSQYFLPCIRSAQLHSEYSIAPRMSDLCGSIRLPWEVIERVFEYAWDDLDLLRSLSLTCHQLRHRSFPLILAHQVFLRGANQVSDFCDLVREKPKLQPFVQSITISPADFRPYPLMKMLPRLSKLYFVSYVSEDIDSNIYGANEIREEPTIALHSIILHHYRLFGTGIRTLSLDYLSFHTYGELFRLLLAFPNATQITCNNIYIKSQANKAFAMEREGVKLCEQLQLETLYVRIYPSSAVCR